jgi:hypothetical protein
MVASTYFAAVRLCELFTSLLEPTIALRPRETNNMVRTTQMPRHIKILPAELIGNSALGIFKQIAGGDYSAFYRALLVHIGGKTSAALLLDFRLG